MFNAFRRFAIPSLKIGVVIWPNGGSDFALPAEFQNKEKVDVLIATCVSTVSSPQNLGRSTMNPLFTLTTMYTSGVVLLHPLISSSIALHLIQFLPDAFPSHSIIFSELARLTINIISLFLLLPRKIVSH